MTEVNKTYQHGSFDTIMALRNKLGCTEGSLGILLGYSTTAVSSWRAQGKAPLVATKLAEYMLKEKGEKSSLYVMLLPQDQKELVISLLSRLDIDLKEVL